MRALTRMTAWRVVVGCAVVFTMMALAGVTDAQTKPQGAGAKKPANDARGAHPKAAPAERKANLAGTVVDTEGRPVARASMWLVQWIDGVPQYRSAVADAEGKFSFADVNTDNGTLVAVADRYSLGGRVHNLDFGPVQPKVRLVVTKPRQLVIQFVDAGGKPVEGVALHSLSWTAAGSSPFRLPLEVLRRERIPIPRSDRRGEMLICDLPSGVRGNLLFKHPEFAVHSLEDVPTDQSEPVKVVLQPGAPLTVEAVVAATGEPVKAATVWVHVESPTHRFYLVDDVDSRGKWSIRLGDARSVSVSIRHAGGNLVTFEHQDFLNWSIADGGRTARFALLRKSKVTGRVVDAKGRPAEGVSAGLVFGQRRTVSAQSDSEGRYVMEGPEGAAKLAVVDGQGYYPKPDEEVAVTLTPDRTATAPDLVAHRVPPLRGIVTAGGRPVPNALVSGENREFAVANAEGQFELKLNSLPYRFARILASHPTERLSGGVIVGREQVEGAEFVRIEVGSESTLRGELTDEKGNALAMVPLVMWSRVSDGGFTVQSTSATAVTNERGEFVFPGLSRHATHRVNVANINSQLPRNEFRELTGEKVELELPPLSDEEVRSIKRAIPTPPAPELLTGTWLNSPPLTLKGLRGKVVLLGRWSTERPLTATALQTAHQLYGKHGVVIVGVHGNSVSEEQVKKFVLEHKLTFPIALDNGDTTLSDQVRASGLHGMILARDGRVVLLGTAEDVLQAVRLTLLYDDAKSKP